jgi:beta-galactosidase
MNDTLARRAAVTAVPSLVPWMAPELTAINRLPMRATLLPYASAAAARAGEGARVLSLDGQWRFRLLPRVEDTPADFASIGLDDAGWASIAVPGNWTMQGHGAPHYTNWKMPFAELPPTVPEANPTGLYRRSFTLPADWAGLRVVLQVGGAESVHGVWVNGVAVGLGKDSRLPSDYDITAFLRPGDNTLAIQCIQWSDASFIEDQDQWWHGGLHRSVFLYATQPAWIEDVYAQAGYDAATGAGSLKLTVRGGGLTATGWTVAAQVYAPCGRALLAAPLGAAVPHGLRGHKRDIEHVAVAETALAGIAPWSAEIPIRPAPASRPPPSTSASAMCASSAAICSSMASGC